MELPAPQPEAPTMQDYELPLGPYSHPGDPINSAPHTGYGRLQTPARQAANTNLGVISAAA